MTRRVLIPLFKDDVAPRFDLAVEVLLADVADDGAVAGRHNYFLAHASADDLCDFILKHEVAAVVTGGIEEEYYHYLRWKRIEVLDGVMGPAETALRRFAAGDLQPGACLYPRQP